jgi:hypothetical protein
MTSQFPEVGPKGEILWYVVWVTPLDVKVGQQQFHVISGMPPPIGSTYSGGIVVRNDGPFSTEADAEADAGSSTGATGVGPGVANTTGTANQPPALPSISVANFLGLLSQRSTWIRVAEVVLFGGLAIIGITKLGEPEIKDAAKVAGTVAK